MIDKYVIILLTAHIAGDFYVQTEERRTAKEKTLTGILCNSVMYYLASLVVIIPFISLDMIIAVTLLSVFHFVIDVGKYIYLKRTRKLYDNGVTFVWVQMVHIISIIILAYFMYRNGFGLTHFKIVDDVFNAFNLEKQAVARVILSLLILHKPTNVMIQNVLANDIPKGSRDLLIVPDYKTGRRIGSVERLIMLMFIALDQYSAMGLVLTAKSIARYDKISKDQTFAEYYLLGTLLSTASVVLCKILIL